MVTEKIKQLQALQAKADELQKSIEADRSQELSELPARYGYDSLPAFVQALKDAGGPRVGRGRKAKRGPARARRAAKPATTAKSAKKTAKTAKTAKTTKSGKKRRTRAKITPEVKARVKAGVEAGKTGSAIAKEVGISLPSVQNIKKELGLVKARG